jgi:hypothetical protein
MLDEFSAVFGEAADGVAPDAEVEKPASPQQATHNKRVKFQLEDEPLDDAMAMHPVQDQMQIVSAPAKRLDETQLTPEQMALIEEKR